MNTPRPAKAEQSALDSLKFTAPVDTLQKDQLAAVGHLTLQLAVALNVTALQIFDAVHKHGHPGRDGTNMDKALGLPLDSAARAMRSIVGCVK